LKKIEISILKVGAIFWRYAPNECRSIFQHRISPVRTQRDTIPRVGLKEIVALGDFCAELTVAGHFYSVPIRMVANNVISHKFLIGNNFLMRNL